jgi:hypothetical protein
MPKYTLKSAKTNSYYYENLNENSMINDETSNKNNNQKGRFKRKQKGSKELNIEDSSPKETNSNKNNNNSNGDNNDSQKDDDLRPLPSIYWMLQDPVDEYKYEFNQTRQVKIKNFNIDLYNRETINLLYSSPINIWSSSRLVSQAFNKDSPNGVQIGPFALKIVIYSYLIDFIL